MEELARIDGSFERVVETLKTAAIGVDEASDRLRDYLDRLEADPKRLDEVESRLAMIERLKRKYGSSLDEVLAFLEHVREQMEAMESAGRAEGQAGAGGGGDGREKFRAAATVDEGAAARPAEKLAKKVETELDSLALGERRVSHRGAGGAASENGVDRVEFLISANAGEEPRPLDKVASGGELSRIALALKTSLGQDGARRTECSGRWCSTRSIPESAAAWRKRWGGG